MALLAVIFTCLWAFAPAQIDKIDNWILRSYIQGPTKRFSDCQKLADKRDNSAEECLNTLLMDDLLTIKKEDRLAKLKREAIVAAIIFYRGKNNFEKVNYWLNTWIAFDDRDLTAKTSRAQFYISVPEKRQEGLTMLSALNNKYPDVKIIADAYKESVAFTNRLSEQ